MKYFVVGCPLIFALVLGAQTEAEGPPMRGLRGRTAAAPIAANPVVEISGTISVVQIGVGQRMPHLEIRKGDESTRLYLGAMHYLIAQDFSPKTGQQVSAKGYKTAEGVVAIEVTLPAEKKTLKLRDENGWPVWRGGRGRQAGQNQAR